MSPRTSPGTIVLIHGLWMTPLSWEHWIEPEPRRRLCRVLERGGLAHARIASQDQDAAAPVGGARQERIERGALLATADKHQPQPPYAGRMAAGANGSGE